MRTTIIDNIDLAAFVDWYRAQPRIPTVDQVRDRLGIGRTSAYELVKRLEADGLVDRRTTSDRWAR